MDREELREELCDEFALWPIGTRENPADVGRDDAYEMADVAIRVVATAIADDLRAQADLVGNMPFGSDVNRMIYMADGLYAAALRVRGLISEDKR